MNTDKLIELYNNTSKHSNYQILARSLSEIVPQGELEVNSRYEQERLQYMLRYLSPQDQSFADIGGNTGYFTFEFLDKEAQSVLLIEGNGSHADFVEEGARVLGLENQLKVVSGYLNFNKDLSLVDVDICLLLNVLHHVGDDYGDQSQSIVAAKANMIESLNAMASRTKHMVFQLGFNWKGDRNFPLFENGTKAELIDFIKSNTSDSWSIKAIGIAERSQDEIVYNDVNDNNIQRDDSLGEFLNRPLFILESKCK